MKKILFIILTLIIFSCEKLEEQTEFLEYENYMQNGWIAFQSSEWDIALDLFNIGLNQASSNHSEAYSGLGWTYLYKANRLYGLENQISRDSLRSLAGINFINAEIETKYDFDIWSDILAGITYIYSYKADSVWYKYYNDSDFQFDSYLESQMVEFSEMAINKSDELFEFEASLDSLYDFQFDSCVNRDNIRYLRAKTFLRLNQIEKMLDELNLITTYQCLDIDTLSSIEQGIDCLNNLSNLLISCHN